MSNHKNNKKNTLNDYANKNKDNKPMSWIKKQVSAPSRPSKSTLNILCDKNKNFIIEKKKYEPIQQNSTITLDHYNKYNTSNSKKSPASLPRLPDNNTSEKSYTDNSDKTDFMDLEIAIRFNSEKWINMSEYEKILWLKQYLCTIKNEIITVYKMVVDFRKEDMLQDELCKLLSLSSMIDIIPQDITDSNYMQTKKDHLIITNKLKELQAQHEDVSLELQNSKSTIQCLQEQLNKPKQDQNTQTHGIRVEELECSLNDASSITTLLNLELDTSKKTIINLNRNIEEKNNEIESISAQNSTLNSKIDSFVKTVKDAEKNDLEKTKRIENLCEEKNKYKYEYIEILRERDEFAEESLELQNKLQKISKQFFELKAATDERRIEKIENSMYMSQYVDEIDDKKNQISQLKDVISKHEDRIEYFINVNKKQSNTIMDLEADVLEKNNELGTWENRAGCWINKFVHEKYVSKIDNLEKEIRKLQVEKQKLFGKYKTSESDSCEKIENNDKIIKIKQSIIDQQEDIINLMRNLNDPSTNNDEHCIQNILNDMFLKYDDVIQRMKNSDELIKENGKLRTLINELKQRLNSTAYTQLL